MSDERTEEATPKRRQETRKKGKVPKSQDFNAALMLIIGVSVAALLSHFMLNELKELLMWTFSSLNPSDINENNLMGVLSPFFFSAVKILMPFLLILLISAILVVGLQVGPLFSIEALKPKVDKLSPNKIWENFTNTFNIFKPQKLVELVKSFVKLLVIGGFAWSVIQGRINEILALLGVDLNSAFAVISDIMAEIIMNICIAMLIIGIFDKIYQTKEFNKSLKMTKQEVKDERKNAEGDPIIKSKIKSQQMRFAQSRMMSNIPTADVVVTNPTHYAVAIRYDSNIAPAPQVVAKGVDFVAFKIREVAENNKIPVVENPPLARALYKLVPVDGIIPAEFFNAVAELLAYVYRKNRV